MRIMAFTRSMTEWRRRGVRRWSGVLGLTACLLGAALSLYGAVPAVKEGAATQGTSSEPVWLKEALRSLPAAQRDQLETVESLHISLPANRPVLWKAEDFDQLSRFPNLKFLSIDGPGLAPGAFERLEGLSHLERLALHLKATDQDMAAVAKIPALKSLILYEAAGLTEAGVNSLSGSGSLEELELWSGFSPLQALAGLKGLKVLRLHISPLTVEKMKAVGALTGPAAIHLLLDRPRRDEATAPYLAPLRGMTNIETLELEEWAPNNPAMEIIGTLAGLKRLDLAEAKIDQDDLACVGKLVKLQDLNLSKTRMINASLAQLASLTDLRKLNLSDSFVTNAGRETLAKFTELRELNLSVPDVSGSMGVGDPTFATLSKLPHLEMLCASACVVTDAGLAQLATMKSLKVLRLRQCKQIGDPGLAHLGKIASLQELNLDDTPVTDKGVRFLAGLKNLRALTLMQCQVTKKTVLETLKDLKGLRVKLSDDYGSVIIGEQ
jgi:internalin A